MICNLLIKYFVNNLWIYKIKLKNKLIIIFNLINNFKLNKIN